MTIVEYLDNLNRRFKTGISTEHTYRGDLQNLLESIAHGVQVTNEPSRVACGAPDYILTRKNIPVGYIEAKDIGIDLKGKGIQEQLNRYRASLNNLLVTDYLDFHLYIEGDFKTSLRISEIHNGRLLPLAENFTAFKNLISQFCAYQGQIIKSPKKLAVMMAAKAKLLARIIENALLDNTPQDDLLAFADANNSLREQLTAFRKILIHDITPKEFADIYAQTIAYGMFAARLHDNTLDTFTRQEAAELIPKTNPFLRKLFQYVAGYDLDNRIVWVVDGLADLFRATDVADLLKNFGSSTQTQDPIIHFYETFLAEYDPRLRKARGVWYTPHPVVNFIVRAVDGILITEFGLPLGLADTSKVKIIKKEVTKATADRRSINKEVNVEHEVHKVQILDPAAGTGTFLAEVINHIYGKFRGQQGIWSNYVEEQLIPRLNGFEILMASYAMAHLKLDMLLAETGYSSMKEQRFRIFLTNSLEEYHPDTGTLFANWLSTEANEANYIKRDTPVMVIIGNPPYSISSNNKGVWIQSLISEYKTALNEKKINLDDDYIKFIRFGQHFIERNGEGILAYITNNSFIDGITHRQMRKHLLETFDKIYILNLHGNSKKKESNVDGGKDENVFDIMQGVSINIFIKKNESTFKSTNTKPMRNEVFHFDLYGKREVKYEFLNQGNITSIPWIRLNCQEPYYFFVPKEFANQSSYEIFFKIDELFDGVSGIETKRDHFAIDFNLSTLKNRIRDFIINDYTSEERKAKFNLKDNEWVVEDAVSLLRKNADWQTSFVQCLTRPFDLRWITYNNVILSRDRGHLMAGMNNSNVGLVLGRQSKEEFAALVTNCVCTHKIVTVYDRSFIFPLYKYSSRAATGQQTIDEGYVRKSNLNLKIVEKIAQELNYIFIEDGNICVDLATDTDGVFCPMDLLDYIYAILHCPSYRKKYKEFLKIDFPRVPYPKNRETFCVLVDLGSKLRQLHLMKSPLVSNFITQYPVGGNNKVEKVFYENGSVYINDAQYIENVPQIAWEFYIGGYQPAQKWLKDRIGRQLTFDEIQHYQKMIVVLVETDRLMAEIDAVDIE